MFVGGKTRTNSDGKVTKGWDHDPPAKEKLVPFGILSVATGALMLLFGSYETSDAWADALQMWWLQVGPRIYASAWDVWVLWGNATRFCCLVRLAEERTASVPSTPRRTRP